MDLPLLRTFLAVVDTGSFTAAGKRRRISQSAVSQQIRGLEAACATSLFTRHARKVTLTQAGNVLVPYAKQILSKADEALAVVSDFEGMGRGRVAIAAGGALCLHILPQLLEEFAARFGKIEIKVVSGFSPQILRLTAEGTVDVGIAPLPVDETELVTTEIGSDELFAVAPAGHPWANLEHVRAKDFSNQRLVAYDRDSQTFKLLERFLLEGGVFPQIAMEINDLEAVKRMVEAGLGVSIVAGWVVREQVKNQTLVAKPLAPSRVYRRWGLIRRTGETPTASQKGFLSICKTRFPGLIGA